MICLYHDKKKKLLNLLISLAICFGATIKIYEDLFYKNFQFINNFGQKIVYKEYVPFDFPYSLLNINYPILIIGFVCLVFGIFCLRDILLNKPAFIFTPAGIHSHQYGFIDYKQLHSIKFVPKSEDGFEHVLIRFTPSELNKDFDKFNFIANKLSKYNYGYRILILHDLSNESVNQINKYKNKIESSNSLRLN